MCSLPVGEGAKRTRVSVGVVFMRFLLPFLGARVGLHGKEKRRSPQVSEAATLSRSLPGKDGAPAYMRGVPTRSC